MLHSSQDPRPTSSVISNIMVTIIIILIAEHAVNCLIKVRHVKNEPALLIVILIYTNKGLLIILLTLMCPLISAFGNLNAVGPIISVLVMKLYLIQN